MYGLTDDMNDKQKFIDGVIETANEAIDLAYTYDRVFRIEINDKRSKDQTVFHIDKFNSRIKLFIDINGVNYEIATFNSIVMPINMVKNSIGAILHDFLD